MHINSFRLILISSTCGTGLACTYAYICIHYEIQVLIVHWAWNWTKCSNGTHTLTHTHSVSLLANETVGAISRGISSRLEIIIPPKSTERAVHV